MLLFHSAIARVVSAIKMSNIIDGIYLNYYRDGNDWAPSHSHPGETQLIISLGATRSLKIGTKTYEIGNGDVIVFGSSSHSIIQDPSITEGRISIATFCHPL